MDRRLNTVYFSATGTTKKVVECLAENMRAKLDIESINHYDFTLPKNRVEPLEFVKEDIVIVGVPVYAGRVPNVLLKYLKKIEGNGAKAVPVVLYGNRNYDDALIELRELLINKGFKILAGGAFIGEHSFSKILGKQRPDNNDISVVIDFANKISDKLEQATEFDNVMVKGNSPIRPYYRPRNPKGEPVDIRKVKPKTNENCVDCKVCVEVCPMGSIKTDNVHELDGICIKCGACIKSCPVGAKYYDDEDYLRHKVELEIEFSERREPEVFL